MKSSEKLWSVGGGNGNPLQYYCPENPMESLKRQKDMTLEVELPRSDSVHYDTGEKQRAIINNSRKK